LYKRQSLRWMKKEEQPQQPQVFLLCVTSKVQGSKNHTRARPWGAKNKGQRVGNFSGTSVIIISRYLIFSRIMKCKLYVVYTVWNNEKHKFCFTSFFVLRTLNFEPKTLRALQNWIFTVLFLYFCND
jgi:hypothetical protein